MADPYGLNEDGTAKDPVAFREALKADPVKLEALEKEPEVYKIVLGEDVAAFQELIKSVYQVRRMRAVTAAPATSGQRLAMTGCRGTRKLVRHEGPWAPPPPAEVFSALGAAC